MSDPRSRTVRSTLSRSTLSRSTLSRSTLSQVQRQAVRSLLQIAPVADELGRLFGEAGHEIALVGGPVRDALLGRLGNDLDFTTSARPEVTERLVTGWADSVWDVGRAFGTIGCRKGEHLLEITTYRSDAYDASSRKPDVRYGDTIAGDLHRRDFTVNAMAVALPGGEFVDPHGGLEDLAAGVLRTPGTPEQSFGDDPLRMLRAARFAAQLGFEVLPDVVAAIVEMAERLSIVSAERVRDELAKLVCSPYPRKGLALLVDTGLADRVTFRQGDLLAPVVGEGPFDAIVSNPPYIPTDIIPTLEPSVRDFEPHLALDGGPDGLQVVRRLIAAAVPLLKPGGHLILEIGTAQEAPVRDLLAAQPELTLAAIRLTRRANLARSTQETKPARSPARQHRRRGSTRRRLARVAAKSRRTSLPCPGRIRAGRRAPLAQACLLRTGGRTRSRRGPRRTHALRPALHS